MFASSRMPEDRRGVDHDAHPTSRRKRPIALEIVGESPDDRVRLSTEDPHLEGSDFDEAIDSLLGEDDATRDDGEQTTEPDAAGMEETGTSELTDATLEAIESIEMNAQSLVEDAIDRLLDEQPDEDPAANDHVPSAAPEKTQDDDDTPSSDISPEALEAQLDALDTASEESTAVQDDLEDLAQDLDALDSESQQSTEPDALVRTDELDAPQDTELQAIKETAEARIAEPEHAEADTPEQSIEDAEQNDHALSSPESEDEPAAQDDDDLLGSIAQDLMDLDDASHADETATEPTPESAEEHQDPDGELAVDSDIAAESTAAEESDPESDPFADAIDEIMNTAETEEAEAESQPEPESASTSESEPSSEMDSEPAVTAPEQQGSDQDGDQILEDASTLADLDATLAGIGDEMLSGDFETPEGERIGSDELGIKEATSLLDQLDIGDLDLDDDPGLSGPAESHQEAAPAPKPEPEPVAQESSVPEATPKPTPTAVAHAATAADQADDAPIPEVESIWQSAFRVVMNLARTAWREGRTHAVPLGAKFVELVNRPVRDRPAIVRDSIGYVAMWTALLSIILWAYIVFVRQSPTPTPSQAPSRMVEPGEEIGTGRTTRMDP
jgi:hypothetical protein